MKCITYLILNLAPRCRSCRFLIDQSNRSLHLTFGSISTLLNFKMAQAAQKLAGAGARMANSLATKGPAAAQSKKLINRNIN
jgi:hypothetical protein